jgi:hypothetical protein
MRSANDAEGNGNRKQRIRQNAATKSYPRTSKDIQVRKRRNKNISSTNTQNRRIRRTL